MLRGSWLSGSEAQVAVGSESHLRVVWSRWSLSHYSRKTKAGELSLCRQGDVDGITTEKE